MAVSDSKQTTVDISWGNLRKNKITIISSIICHVGGILFIFSSIHMLLAGGSPVAATYGIFIILGAIVGLKYQIGGFLHCLIIGIFSTLFCQTVLMVPLLTSVPCIKLSALFLYGTIITIIGSVIGLIGGVIKKIKQDIEPENAQLKLISRKLSIFSSMICYFGGMLFMSSAIELYFSTKYIGSEASSIGWKYWYQVIIYGILVIIGAISGIKYRIGGPLLCIITVIFSSLVCQTYVIGVTPFFYKSPNSPCLSQYNPMFLSATILTMLGSIAGLIGAIINKREQKRIEN